MLETRHEISAKQLFTLLFAAQTGIGMLSIPSHLAGKLGHDGWISLLASGLLSLPLFLMLGKFMQKFKDKSIVDINVILFGRMAGTFMNLILTAYLMFAAVIGIRLFNDVIKIMALKQTPPLVVTCFIMLPTIYISFYGLRIIGRFSNFIVPIIIVVFLFFLMNLPKIHLSFLLPIGETGLPAILSGTYDAFFAFVGFELILFYYPYVKDREKAVKWGFLACTMSIGAFCFVTAFTTALFGENMIKQLTLPMFYLSRCYFSSIFERVDLFFTMMWFPAMAISLRAYFFAGYQSICKMTNNKKPTMTLIIYSMTLILASRLPKNLLHAYNLTDILSKCTIILLVYVLFCYLFSLYKLRKEGNPN